MNAFCLFFDLNLLYSNALLFFNPLIYSSILNLIIYNSFYFNGLHEKTGVLKVIGGRFPKSSLHETSSWTDSIRGTSFWHYLFSIWSPDHPQNETIFCVITTTDELTKKPSFSTIMRRSQSSETTYPSLRKNWSIFLIRRERGNCSARARCPCSSCHDSENKDKLLKRQVKLGSRSI